MGPALPFIIAGAAVITAGASVASAIVSHRQGEEQLELQEESLASEEKYREEQRQIQIAELESEIASLTESMGGIGGQALYEYGQIGERGLETYSAQRALTAIGGAEVSAGSPLQAMSGTLRMAQSDLAYKQAYYAAELARTQATITGLEEQLGILRGGGAKSVTPTSRQIGGPIYGPIEGEGPLVPPERYSLISQPITRPIFRGSPAGFR